MTAITINRISEKLENLGEYIKYLERVKKDALGDKSKFVSDFYYFGTAERYFQLSIQVIIDIIQLIVIEEGLERPGDNQEIISLLFNEKIISKKLVPQLEGMVGFRNLLVHEYGKIDKGKVFEHLQNDIDDFELFRKEISKYLLKK